MLQNVNLEIIEDFKTKKNPYADLSFLLFQNSVQNKEDCLQINLIKTLNEHFPKTIDVVIKWYFTKDVDEVLVETINREVLEMLQSETKKETTY